MRTIADFMYGNETSVKSLLCGRHQKTIEMQDDIMQKRRNCTREYVNDIEGVEECGKLKGNGISGRRILTDF